VESLAKSKFVFHCPILLNAMNPLSFSLDVYAHPLNPESRSRRTILLVSVILYRTGLLLLSFIRLLTKRNSIHAVGRLKVSNVR